VWCRDPWQIDAGHRTAEVEFDTERPKHQRQLGHNPARVDRQLSLAPECPAQPIGHDGGAPVARLGRREQSASVAKAWCQFGELPQHITLIVGQIWPKLRIEAPEARALRSKSMTDRPRLAAR
jgi:hypothetical protein